MVRLPSLPPGEMKSALISEPVHSWGDSNNCAKAEKTLVCTECLSGGGGGEYILLSYFLLFSKTALRPGILCTISWDCSVNVQLSPSPLLPWVATHFSRVLSGTTRCDPGRMKLANDSNILRRGIHIAGALFI